MIKPLPFFQYVYVIWSLFINGCKELYLAFNRYTDTRILEYDDFQPFPSITHNLKLMNQRCVLLDNNFYDVSEHVESASESEHVESASESESESDSLESLESEETQYIRLILDILSNGAKEESRNGPTLSIFGHTMRFSLKDGQLPLITTKYVAWKTCFNELMWFIRGSTDNRDLQKNGVHIWDLNSSREFLDSRGLTTLAEGDLGPVYGHQWRHFNAKYIDSTTDYTGIGVDQLAAIIRDLKTPENRASRRMILCAWNPEQIGEMALPPCHMIAQFNVREGRYLSCALFQRSGDVGLGVPFNIASYSFLTHMLAHHCGLEADEFVYFLGNAHIYEEHVEPLETQILKTPFPFPKIRFSNIHENIDDYDISDIEWVEPYKHGPKISMELR